MKGRNNLLTLKESRAFERRDQAGPAREVIQEAKRVAAVARSGRPAPELVVKGLDAKRGGQVRMRKAGIKPSIVEGLAFEKRELGHGLLNQRVEILERNMAEAEVVGVRTRIARPWPELVEARVARVYAGGGWLLRVCRRRWRIGILALDGPLLAIQARLGRVASLLLADTAVAGAAAAGRRSRGAIAGLDMAFQHVRALEGGTTQSAAVRSLRRVRAAVPLEVLAALVRLEAHGTAVESLGVGHGGPRIQGSIRRGMGCFWVPFLGGRQMEPNSSREWTQIGGPGKNPGKTIEGWRVLRGALGWKRFREVDGSSHNGSRWLLGGSETRFHAIRLPHPRPPIRAENPDERPDPSTARVRVPRYVL